MASKKSNVTTKKASKRGASKKTTERAVVTTKNARRIGASARAAAKNDRKSDVSTKATVTTRKASKGGASKKATEKKGKATAQIDRTITATITLTGEPSELKACVEDIIEAAKKIVEKEIRKQIKKA